MKEEYLKTRKKLKLLLLKQEINRFEKINNRIKRNISIIEKRESKDFSKEKIEKIKKSCLVKDKKIKKLRKKYFSKV